MITSMHIIYLHPPIEHTVNIAISFLFVTWKMRVIASYDDEEG